MNKNDFKLIMVVLGFSILMFLLMNANKKDVNTAVVYYDNDEVMSMSLSENKEYIVEGELGEVIIEVKDNKVRVNEENSPRHLCSKQGWISKQNESIICLPNRIIIMIKAEDDLDAVVK